MIDQEFAAWSKADFLSQLQEMGFDSIQEFEQYQILEHQIYAAEEIDFLM